MEYTSDGRLVVRASKVKEKARELCEAAGEDPDRLVHWRAPEQIPTPIGIVYGAGAEGVPLYTAYMGMAQQMIARTAETHSVSQGNQWDSSQNGTEGNHPERRGLEAS